MGVVQKQASRSIFVLGFSLLLGIINNLFIYPKFVVFYGFLQTILSFVRLVSPLSIWGLDSVMNKYHAYFKTSRSRKFHKLILNWFSISFSIFSVFYFLTVSIVSNFNLGEVRNFNLIFSNLMAIWVFVLAFSLLRIAYVYQIIQKFVAISTFYYKTLLPKIGIPILLIAGSFFAWSKEELLNSLIVFCFGVFFLMAVVGSRNQDKSSSDNLLPNLKELLNYGTYGIFNSFSSMLAFSIDILLVGLLINEEAAGLYAIFLFLANTIRIPLDSVSLMLLPIFGTLWKDNDFKSIKEYYSRTGNGLFMLAMGMFLMIFLSLNDILLIIGKPEVGILAKYVVLFIGISIIIDSITSVNTHIIVQSDKFRWNLVFTILLGVLNLILTFCFIVYLFDPPYQAIGAALSTSISIILVNLIKTIFVYRLYQIHPFNKKMLLTIFLSGITFVIMYFMNFTSMPWVNLFIINGLVCLLYFFPAVLLKISKDINDIISKYLRMLNINVQL